MEVESTQFKDVFILKPKIFEDSRGYFFESFNERQFQNQGIKNSFVQDNQSRSSFGTIRGLHYQLAPYSQAKLIRVLEGTIFDVIVDIRKGSPTYGEWMGIELSDNNFLQLLIPHGFAHGFSVLSDQATILYKCDNYYSPEHERGINYSDKTLNIDWKIPAGKAIVSTKDKVWPAFDKAEMNFKY